ncbi:uncharacterized protein LOC127007248 isoform X1 [Eriocheir sinensis]|uniref:uncharacterized protein LOC127007248 isoform X1 n=1 Tax=Eriocheir sinensis TaxID=95602 RepID=UPI0021C7BEED|nr:uncharacterized protein LOC127007248 isoform X1 [Eriocheir sinensis]XP_050733935.1 uncharacterized protein LOC127007248 isoform X1 [Eriocheir sinensis]XP_050733936.1 uncharacterized protein LOC127007248 isoform X1 [Eriocheir sinensis]
MNENSVPASQSVPATGTEQDENGCNRSTWSSDALLAALQSDVYPGIGSSSGTVLRNFEKKRTDYLPWDDYFMAVAFLSGMRSKDPCTQVGACIVNADKKIVGVGYNGMPNGCSDDELPWGKKASDPLDNKYMYVCHAEMNAIMNNNSPNLADCSIYVALFPCNECAKLIIQAGIKKVLYFSDKHRNKPQTKASKRLLDMAGVEYRLCMPSQKTIDLNLSSEEPEQSVTATKDNCAPNRGMNKDGKREDYLPWEDYFMAVATLSSLRSKDPVTQVGACIVDHNNRIIGIGYNGMPVGCSDDELPWGKTNKLDNKDMYVCHAGVNAIMNKNTDVFGCTLYTTLFPCNECAKVIIQAGIKNIIYASDKQKIHIQCAKKMLDMAGVKYSAYNQVIKRTRKVVINFEAIDSDSLEKESCT